MENPVPLSLGRWPTEPLSRNFQPSPTTLRIIKNVKVEVDSLLPISFAKFVIESNLINVNKSEAQQLYQREVDRRNKKVEILQGIWTKIQQKRSKSAKQSLSAKSSCLIKIRENISKRSSSKSFHTCRKKSNKSKSPLIFKAKSPGRGETYFDYYNTNKQHKIEKKKEYEEESTQSRREKTATSHNNDEYFSSRVHAGKGKKNTDKAKQNISISIAKIMRHWEELDNKHSQELQETTDLTERQRKRLLKIHQIEKQKMKKQIEHLKIRLGSPKKLNKCFS